MQNQIDIDNVRRVAQFQAAQDRAAVAQDLAVAAAIAGKDSFAASATCRIDAARVADAHWRAQPAPLPPAFVGWAWVVCALGFVAVCGLLWLASLAVGMQL